MRRAPSRSICRTTALVLTTALLGVGPQIARAQNESRAAAPQIVFVTGDDEYGSETSMPMIAEILSKRHGMTATVLYSVNDKGERDRHGQSIPGLEALKTADLAVFFMRFRALPQDQLDAILDYTKSAKPMIGLRTATHAFQYPAPPNNEWNDKFGKETWGQKWIDHYGHGNSSDALVVATQADNPILRGVEPKFWLHSWLYVMNRGEDKLPGDITVLLEGDAVKGAEPGGEHYGERQPVAWTRQMAVQDSDAKKRVFYASLGHPKDFEFESARRLLVNAVYWGLGREEEIPADGADVTMVGPYEPEDPH